MSKSSKEAWDAAAKASADREAAEAEEAPKKRGRPKKREQTRLPLSSASDEVKVSVKIELHRPMTDEEWREQSEILAHDRVELMTLEEEIAALKRKHAPRMKVLRENTAKGARQCDAKEWLTLTDCIEVHNPNTRTVRTYADVLGEPGAQVMPDRAMREDEYERAIKGSPFATPPLEAPTGGQSEAP